jgi:hypothetical protein
MRFFSSVALFTLALLLSSCAASPVLGPASASVSGADVREIKALVAQRPDINQGVLKIWADRTDRISVTSGSQSYDGAEYSQFTVVKKNGRWHISSSIKKARVYATG